MPSLKALRVRITSVKTTQKITSAMKMVAAAKLRRAQEQAEAARPYAERMARMLGSLAGSLPAAPARPPLLAGTGKDQVHLVVVDDLGPRPVRRVQLVDRARRAPAASAQLLREGKTVKILTVGRKGRDQLRRDYGKLIVDIDGGRRQAPARLRRRAARHRPRRRHVRGGRVRRLHGHLQPLQVGDHARS